MPLTAQDLVAQAKAEVPAISAHDYKDLRKRGDEHVLIDVRERDEWDAGHIDDAIHIPRGFLEFKIEQAVPDKNAEIVVHCASGGRSALSVQALRKMGYLNVKNLEGGYTEYCKTAA